GVNGGEGIVSRQDGCRIRTREVDRAQVTRQRVVIGVLGGDRETERRAGGSGRRRREAEVRVRAHRNSRFSSGNGGIDCVGGRNGLCPCCVERGAKGIHAGVAAAKSVFGRQDRLAVTARERHGAGIAGGGIAEGVL